MMMRVISEVIVDGNLDINLVEILPEKVRNEQSTTRYLALYPIPSSSIDGHFG
jgi:hypothetical protein